ncbi:hypothetical protein BX616_004227 [Lobosporangium transversale]|uniref:Uncharacterized protein n=1 Tax=Lobosporangium transversale TaxID=64571 RepID=A0A1Y2GIL1_9FUNG|nr:hypothetical protein BCR41DRAFT_424493 [Lobosporangium transversale]KAF9916255.1 hypothetical protein BX616_004227 [Lobosporangium transversale]ORZ08532.1 hypothetical protein BCR41DRAFT_424493 [Lobosporangium transversale]|eukprot:XP_021878460.1 hypothetical protein BCR41DRAFT_424493 [Lobosporangium transversale]
MNKKELCTGLWGQFVKDTKVFANQIFGKILNKPPAGPSTQSAYEHQRQYDSQYHHQHPYSNVSYTSTLSLVNITTASHISLESSATYHHNPIQEMTLQYESLWEVQLALGEIPSIFDAGNILQPYQSSQYTPFPSRPPTEPIQYPHQYQQQRPCQDYSLPDLATSISSSFSPSPMSFEAKTKHQFHSPGGSGNAGHLWFRPIAAQAHSYTSSHFFSTSVDEAVLEYTFPIRDSSICISQSNSDINEPDDDVYDDDDGDDDDAMINMPSKVSELRHDRKDSGVFIQDGDEGIILQRSPKTTATTTATITAATVTATTAFSSEKKVIYTPDHASEDENEYVYLPVKGHCLELRSRIMGDDILHSDAGLLALSLPSLMATVSTLSIQA